jgi:hypothetical protein
VDLSSVRFLGGFNMNQNLSLCRKPPAVLLAAFLIPLTNSSQHARAAGAPTTAPAATPAPPAPTIDEVQSALSQKDYQTAIKLASKLLALHGPAAQGLNRYQLLMAKAEAQVGMKTVSSASLTFRAAAKETGDLREKGLAQWTGELLHRAGSTTYTPKQGAITGEKRGPFDLTDLDQRKDALAALLDEYLTAIAPDVKTATRSQKLPEILPVLKRIADLNLLDIVVNGSDDKTAGLGNELLDHARTLLTTALKTDWARLNDIDAHASATTTVPVQQIVNGQSVTQNVTRANGLSNSNRQEISNIIEVCGKIHDAADSFAQYAKDEKDWAVIISDTDRVLGKASDILNTNYSANATAGDNSSTAGTQPQVGANSTPGYTYPSQTTGQTPSQTGRPGSSGGQPPARAPSSATPPASTTPRQPGKTPPG